MDHHPSLATAQQEAYRYLRDRILSGELAGASAINPTDIAQRLGISRIPVREALRQLDAEGLVTMPPNRRPFVTRLTRQDVEDLFEIRTALEVMGVRTAVAAMTDEAYADLVALVARMDRVRNDPAEWLKRHDDFHQAICAVGGRPRLQREIARVRLAIRPYLLVHMRIAKVVEQPGLEHKALLQALKSGNVARAEKAMREHVSNPGAGLLRFLEERANPKAPARARAARPASKSSR
jgi:DNA-binding GntR family transcriptional regulator